MANKSVKRKTSTNRSNSRINATSKRSTTLSASSASPMKIQREINKDYKVLFEDYKRLSREILKLPATKYILGGVAITTMVPVIMNLVRRNKKIDEIVRTNLDAIEEKVGAVGEVISDKLNSMRQNKDVELDDTRH